MVEVTKKAAQKEVAPKTKSVSASPAKKVNAVKKVGVKAVTPAAKPAPARKAKPRGEKKLWEFEAGDVVDYVKNDNAHRCTVVAPRGAHVNVRFSDGRCQDVIKKRLVHV